MLNTQTKVQALFKIVAVNPETNQEKNLTDWFPNLVLNNGLNRMSQGAWINRVLVGSGNSIPSVNQTTLDNFVASTTGYNGTITPGSQLVTMPYYLTLNFVFRFNQGVAAGNLSEIGLGWSNTECWNRALILDTNGNPTTITVLDNEFLDIHIELRIYPKLEDTVLSFNLRDDKNAIISTHTATIRPNLRTTLSTTQIGAGAIRVGRLDTTTSSGGSISIYPPTANMGDILTNIYPSSHLGSISSAIANDSYPTPRSSTAVFKGTITQVIGDHAIIVVPTGLGTYKVAIDPPITKLNTESIEHSFTVLWDRYTE